MEKVTYKTLNSANVKVDNSVDTERVYDISANVNIGNMTEMDASPEGINNVSSIDSGLVKRKADGMTVATFNSDGDNNLSINHKGTDSVEQCEVTNVINAFISEVKSKVQTVSPVSL